MMDPRNLHIQFEHVVGSVNWTRPNKHEYFLIGDGETFDLEHIQAALDGHFETDVVLASPSRHEAIVLERSSASFTIAQHVMRIGSITVFDSDLSKFMQFLKTGVARQGVAAT